MPRRAEFWRIVLNKYQDVIGQVLAFGYGFALLATMLWAGNFVVARAVAEAIPPWQLNFWRWLIGLVVLIPFAWKPVQQDWPILKRNWRYLSIMGIIGVTLLNTLIYKAGQTTESLNMALLVPAAPVVILLLSRVLYKELITGARLAGLLVVLVGMVVLISRGEWQRLAALQINSGDLWTLAGVICFGLYSLFMRQRPVELSTLSFNAATFSLGLLFSLPFTVAEAILLPLPSLSVPVVIGVLYTGIGCSALAYWFWTLAIDRIGPVRAGIVYYSLPVFTGLASVFMLREQIVWAQIVGGGLVIGGICAATLIQPRRNNLQATIS